MLNDTQKEVIGKLVDRWLGYTEKSREMFHEIENQTRLWAETTDEYGNSVRVSLLETEDGQRRAIEAMIENMRNNREATAEWSNNLDLLASKTSFEFAEHMRNMGVGAAGYVQAMLNSCDDLLNELSREFNLAGHQATKNLYGSLGDGSIHVAELVRDIGLSSGQALDRAIKDANFPLMGQALPRGLVEGARSGHPEAIRELQSQAREIGFCYRRILGINSPSTVFAEIGLNIMQGLNQGLLNGEAATMATANRIANNIANTMRRALAINSPSRVMRDQIGRQIPAGVAAGIDKYSCDALESMYGLGKDLTKVKFLSIYDLIKPSATFGYSNHPGFTNSSFDQRTVNNYDRLFEGANIHWHNKEDIRNTMEEIAWATQREKSRMW